MSALFRTITGVVAIGLSCLPLGAVVAQQSTTRAPNENSAQSQNNTANPAGRSDAATAPRLNQPSNNATPGRQPYTANFRGTQANAGGQSAEVENYLANCL